MRLAIRLGLTINFALGTINLVVQTYEGAPPHAGQTWDDLVVSHILPHEGSTATRLPWSVLTASANTALDLYILLLPLPLTYKMKLPTRKRIQMALIFLTGLL